MKTMSLRCYRVGLNGDALASAAAELVKSSQNIDVLAPLIGWDQPESRLYLEEAFKPQADANELVGLFEKLVQFGKLKERRIQRGFPDLVSPRKGFGGWWQKRYDKKEFELPIHADVLEWLNRSKRLALLIAMHESLLQHAMIGEAVEVDLAEITSLPRSIGDMVAEADVKKAEVLAKTLRSPLHKMSPEFLIDGVTGYVSYQVSRGFAYYYA